MYEEHDPKIAKALVKLDRLDESAEELGHTKYLEQLSQFEEEFKELGMLQDILFRQGKGLYSLERYDEAIPKFEEAIELGDCDPRDRFILEALQGLGCCYFKKRQWKEAMDAFMEAGNLLQHHFDSRFMASLVSFYWFKGRTHMELDEHKQGLKSLRKALKLTRKAENMPQVKNDIQFDLAACYHSAGHFRRAYSSIEKVEVGHLGEYGLPQYYELKCLILYDMRSYKSLFRVSNQFVALNAEGSMAMAWYYSGIAYFAFGNKEEGRLRLGKALESPDDRGWAHDRSRRVLARWVDKSDQD